jgi:hypothetical protein
MRRTSRSFVPVVMAVAFFSAAARGSSDPTLCPAGTVCVTTWHNDTYRTGDNLSEGTITASSIQNDNFGQLCLAQLDGQVYAQPLIVTGVQIPQKGTLNVAYVVTENDSVYAINATPPATGGACQILLGPVSLLVNNFAGQPTMSPASCGNIGGPQCSTIKPTVGILGTPVINVDTASNTGTLYVVAEMQSGSSQIGFTFYHFLHALDITTLLEGIGNEKFGAPVQICGTGCGSYTNSSLFSGKHIQRPGLLFANCGSGCGNANYVYVAFSMMDGNPTPYPNGFVFGYNATNLRGGTVLQFQTTDGTVQNSNGGGIWMGGAGPAFGTDASGQSWIYLTTANGTFDLDTGGTDAGDSFLKLNPANLTIATPTGGGYLTPVDQYYRSAYGSDQCNSNSGDIDFGSGGVMLIPDGDLTNWHYLAVNGEKEGGLWFVDRTNPGGFDLACTTGTPPPCNCTPTKAGNNIQTYWTGSPYTTPGFAIHTSPAYWQYDVNIPTLNYLYVTQQQVSTNSPAGPLIRYPLCNSSSATGPIDLLNCTGAPVKASNSGSTINFGWGATPSISANGTGANDAIVWAISKPDLDTSEGTTPGILYAIDAVSMQQLYSSSTCGLDQIAPATKFSVPTVANGYVYLGTQQTVSCPGTICYNTGEGNFYIFGPGGRC